MKLILSDGTSFNVLEAGVRNMNGSIELMFTCGEPDTRTETVVAAMSVRSLEEAIAMLETIAEEMCECKIDKIDRCTRIAAT